mmetsp:Transcript_40679/g.82009  ORF Transcript_40679/g.82009 Transcript_40679/m.82009 type:complete len:174 (-) Transcript_40679:161-682(-)
MDMPWQLLLLVAALSAVVFHFRMDLAQQFVEAVPGEADGMRALVWASALQRFGGTGSTQGTCCFAADWKKLAATFCDGNLGVVQDAIPMLGHCTAYVRGRAEFPIKMFQRGGYHGNLTQRRDGIYLIKDVSWEGSTRKSHQGDEEGCKAIRKCLKAKSSDTRCRDLRRSIEEC